ncbi:hypothetical protein SLEP1_g5405 [Rubroshorea leprosula]|uniref:Uncharacterized protein n=1 Tax=Rubroshorea leprosula TaxID=152421 RepID=A0AAV5I0P0_9ROSI|nr:hypothetical protein SLEP1_g5405 [Rubroshorea leprosula]
MKDTVEPFKTTGTNFAEKPSIAGSYGIKVPEINEQKHATGNADVQMRSDRDQIMVESCQFQESVQFQEVLSTKIATTNEVTEDPQGTEQFVSIRSTMSHEVTVDSQGQGTETELGRAALGRHEVVSGVNVLQDKVEGVANISGNTPSVIPRTEKVKILGIVTHLRDHSLILLMQIQILILTRYQVESSGKT